MSELNRFCQTLEDIDTFNLFNDFYNFASGSDGWTSLAVDAGSSVAVGDARRGIAVLTTGATDNNEVALKTTNNLFLPVAAKPIYGRVRLQYSEANVSAANVFAGFCSALAADTLVDNGGGPRTTGTICGIYKVDGGTVWRCVTRNGTTVTDTVSTTTAGGSADQVLEIELGDWDGVSMVCVFSVNGVKLRDSNNNLIRHTMPIASAALMMFGVYAKAGSANSEVINVDFGYAAQAR